MRLMQIMPATSADLRAWHRFGKNPCDPRDNIVASTAYLRQLHNRYGSSGFLATYDAGPGRYEESLAGRPLPTETRA
jgi:soluble lytic murein transglycosylase-like protein